MVGQEKPRTCIRIKLVPAHCLIHGRTDLHKVIAHSTFELYKVVEDI